MRFLDGIPATRKEELLKQLKAVWTHDSTAIEGNTLTLGDTMFVLGYGLTVKGKPLKDQIDAYVRTHVGFTSIHPFYDGNGRLARLLSNLPVLFAGYPLIVIPVESRQDYLQALWDYERGNTDLSAFMSFVRICWRTTLDLVAEARR